MNLKAGMVILYHIIFLSSVIGLSTQISVNNFAESKAYKRIIMASDVYYCQVCMCVCVCVCHSSC